jgi:hypothetical protein
LPYTAAVERIGDRFRHHDRGGEMDDGGDAVLMDGLGHQRAVAGRAGDEGHRARDQEAEAGRQIVEHDHGLAGIDQGMHHVAADIAGAAGHQDRHELLFMVASAVF